jgi:hypothetical protein
LIKIKVRNKWGKNNCTKQIISKRYSKSHKQQKRKKNQGTGRNRAVHRASENRFPYDTELLLRRKGYTNKAFMAATAWNLKKMKNSRKCFYVLFFE